MGTESYFHLYRRIAFGAGTIALACAFAHLTFAAMALAAVAGWYGSAAVFELTIDEQIRPLLHSMLDRVKRAQRAQEAE